MFKLKTQKGHYGLTVIYEGKKTTKILLTSAYRDKYNGVVLLSKKFKCPYCGELTLEESIKEGTITEIYFTIVFGDELHTGNLTSILGIIPDYDRSWNKGDERKRIKEQYYEFSRWSMPSIFTEDLIIEEQVLEYIKPLQNKIELLNELKIKFGLSYSVEIVSRINNHENIPALGFSKELIEFCYRTKSEIDIDMYL